MHFYASDHLEDQTSRVGKLHPHPLFLNKISLLIYGEIAISLSYPVLTEEAEITAGSKIYNGFIYQMLEFPYERLSDHLSLFCVFRDKYHDDKFAQTKQKLENI